MTEPNILIAEDEALTRNGLKRLLAKSNGGAAKVDVAEDGESAWRLIREGGTEYDLILADIRMPKLNGLELLKRLRDEGIGSSVILLTGYADFEYARTALRLGASNYLLKPVDEEQIMQAVDEGLRFAVERRQADANARLIRDNPELFDRAAGAIRHPIVRKALEYIADHLHLPIGIREVAEAVHLNASYFSELFKQETNASFSDYLIALRLRKAKELLLTTDRKIYEIAEETGYGNASYFVKVFRESEGMTPKQFRDQY
ncbi:response regulator [Paenibacillus sp.]|uniref:response regulator transcription factor n=1 Tax=Paenibacillus sp. TaxID=58172 RepID=UPI00281206FF|nr:response regulator [Paenibacillus sp.]